MKVLVAHNHYRSSAPSGEDQVFQNEVTLLRRHGIDVTIFERFNDDIDDSSLAGRLRVAHETAWSDRSYQDLEWVLRKSRPDVVHFHNTFPIISPSAYAACRDNGVPVVQTLHNFRLICPGGLLLRNGTPCEKCIGGGLFSALRHRCYRGSLPATGALVWMLLFNRWRDTYGSLVNRYIALTEFAAGRLIAGGLPRERVAIKPNFVSDIHVPGDGQGGFAVYVGRLSQEKGVHTLLSAWKTVQGVPLRVLGDGPLRKSLEEYVSRENLPIQFLGFCNRRTVIDTVSRAAFQIVPSEWYEGFPMVIADAYALGTPIIASRIGSLEEIVEEGVTGTRFEAGNAADLAAKVQALWHDHSHRATLRQGARHAYESKFSAERNFEMLIAVYEAAMGEHTQLSRKAS
ncbi:Glycosyl transferase group 1 [Nitrospira japonica]|uniref:Glycosyl transferase group 1 n=1 Tax=Nitrospira japonica TaxID=1325564 RepID=A0A1W1I9A6_9BACT|nr:glycosyltransferase family 4 protein [Nitrospira japonica]SLM49618.1 Glycosyl transferase group 1 [Nitrospira japonica]